MCQDSIEDLKGPKLVEYYLLLLSVDDKNNAVFTFDATGLAKCKIFSKYSAASQGSFTEETFAFFC